MGASSKSTNDSYKLEISHLRDELKRLQAHKQQVIASGNGRRGGRGPAGGDGLESIDFGIRMKKERIAYLQNLMKKK